MKHAREALALMIILVTPLLFSGIIVPVDFEAKAPLTQSPIKVSLPSYEVISPIIALNDTAMDYYASLLTWEGNGQPDTPYIIEGYNITSDSDCINIEQTSRAFEIRNCYLSSWSGYHGYGIDIDNVTQGAVFDSVIEGKSLGIIVSSTPAFAVNNCTIHGGDYGVDLESSHGGQITGCHFYENLVHGIYIFQSNNTMIAENEIHDSLDYGIFLSGAHYTIIQNNLVTSCNGYGLDVGTSHYVVVENNIIRDTVYGPSSSSGINLDRSPFASIVGNEIYNNSRNGIYIASSDEVYIFDNEIYENSDHGIDAVNSDNGTIIQNNIHSNGWWPILPNAMCGIYLGGATNDWIISDNSIWNNTPAGITLEGSARAFIDSNDIFNNTEEGIYAFNSAQLVIQENRIHGNGWDVIDDWEGHGIYFSGPVMDSRIEGNEVFNNTHYGIYAYGDRNEIIGNEVYDHPDWGIAIIMCLDDTVAENIVHNNGGAGIEVYSIGSNITDNIVFDNELGIHLYASMFCRLWGNDIGWNDDNALEESPLPTNMWFNNVTGVGNWWGDYNGTGFYYVSNGTHAIYPDMYPSKSLDLVKPAPIDYEILETGNVIVWDASALNPSHYEVFVDSVSVLIETWDGNDIEYLADGLSHGLHTIEVEVYHISGHSTGNSTTADVEDLTPPDIDGQIHVVITVGDTVSNQFNAEDPSGIASWAVNDTVNFAVDSTGLLTSITELPVGEYNVRITVTDTYGNSAFHDCTISVIEATDGGGFPTAMILVIGSGTAVVVVVGLVLYLRKRGT